MSYTASSVYPAASISATGIVVPNYSQLLTWLESQYQAIYGSDVYLGNDSQDGQLLAIFALALNDAYQTAVAVFNSFSPSTAQGAGLSSVVKINGLTRDTPTNSQVDLVIVGQVGTRIAKGYAIDTANQQWDLPHVVFIPVGGTITVTATADTVGSLTAAPGTITTIGTPTRGWQTVTNPSSATPGQPVETDSQLRQRQTISTSRPAQTVLEGLTGDIAAILGVTRYLPYENFTSSTDANGVPSHSIAYVVEGGDPVLIAQTIASKKTPGTGTYGTTSETVVDNDGVTRTISFSRPVEETIDVTIALTALAGYNSTIGLAIQSAVTSYLSSLSIGSPVYQTRLVAVANLPAAQGGLTYDVTSVTLGIHGSSLSTSNVTLSYNQVATPGTITVTAS